MGNFQDWFDQSIGRLIDMDGDGSMDCVDIPESWSRFLWPNISATTTLGYGDAKDHFANASSDYWDKLTGIIPQQGDVVVFGATPFNKYGHIAVVISADNSGMSVIEQNTYTQAAAYTAQRPYINVTGYLRPKGVDMIQTDDEAAEVVRGEFKREPQPNEVSDLKGREWYDALKLYRTSAAGQQVQAQVDNYNNVVNSLDQANTVIGQLQAGQQVEQKTITDLQTQLTEAQKNTGLDQATKDQIANTNSVVNWIKDLLSRIFK